LSNNFQRKANGDAIPFTFPQKSVIMVCEQKVFPSFFIRRMGDPLSLLTSTLMAAGLGGLIGLEREMRIQEEEGRFTSAGLRSFAMLAVLGFTTGKLFFEFEEFWFFGISFAAVIILLISSHTYLSFKHDQFGITSELSALGSF
jgi:hypothetical protein